MKGFLLSRETVFAFTWNPFCFHVKSVSFHVKSVPFHVKFFSRSFVIMYWAFCPFAVSREIFRVSREVFRVSREISWVSRETVSAFTWSLFFLSLNVKIATAV